MPKSVIYPLEPVSFFKNVGTMGALAVAIAGMAPTMAMNLNPQEPAGHVGRIVPLVFAVSAVLVLLVAWCFALLARKHPNAGSAYGFVSAVMGPQAGLMAGWLLLGTYVCFSVLGVAAFGLFGANLLNRLALFNHPSSFLLAMVAVVLLTPLSLIPARRVAFILILLEGIAIIAMVLMALAVISDVLGGHGPQGDPPLRDLFIPTPGVGVSAIAMGLSFGFLSFAGLSRSPHLGRNLKNRN